MWCIRQTDTRQNAAMPQQMDLASLKWWRFDAYEIRAGYIRPALGAKLMDYNPWIEYNKNRTPSDQSPRRVPYHSLLELVSTLFAQPRLTNDGEKLLLDWCVRHGLLGVLLQRTSFLTLAARWVPLPKIPGLKRIGPKSSKGLVASYTQVARSNTGWREDWSLIGEFGISKSEWAKRKEGRPLSLGAMKELGVVPSVHLQELDHFKWGNEPLGKTWARFFPDVPSSEAETYDYPLPSTPEFWRQYAEPVESFLGAARILYNSYKELEAAKHFHEPSELERILIRQGWDRLNALLSAVSPALHVRNDWTFEQVWVPASLLGAYAMMLLTDLDEQAPILRCLVCGTIFTSISPKAKYCSTKCRRTQQKRANRERKKK